jgi:hypothetical protein
VIDLTGSVVVVTREDPGILAIVGVDTGTVKVGTRERGKAWDAPFVIVDLQDTTRSPGSGRAANARLSKQTSHYSVLCYGVSSEQAIQLAYAFTDVWHERGITDGTNGAVIRQAWADTVIGPVIDQALKRPYTVVLLDVHGEAAPLS